MSTSDKSVPRTPYVSPEEVVLLGFFNELPRPATEEDEAFGATFYEVQEGPVRLLFSWAYDRSVTVDLSCGDHKLLGLYLQEAITLRQAGWDGRQALQVDFDAFSLWVALRPLLVDIQRR